MLVISKPRNVAYEVRIKLNRSQNTQKPIQSTVDFVFFLRSQAHIKCIHHLHIKSGMCNANKPSNYIDEMLGFFGYKLCCAMLCVRVKVSCLHLSVFFLLVYLFKMCQFIHMKVFSVSKYALSLKEPAIQTNSRMLSEYVLENAFDAARKVSTTDTSTQVGNRKNLVTKWK